MIKTATTYAEFANWVKVFKAGKLNVLFVVGAAGYSKSHTIRTELGKENERRGPIWRRGGSLTAFQLYKDLYVHRNKTFVLDDTDSLYRDAYAVRLLKALCETEETKRVGWHTATKDLDKFDIPREFETDSRVVIILNDIAPINGHLKALENRGLLLKFQPTFDEVFSHAKKWFKDKEILKFVESHRKYIRELSLRDMVVAAETKQVDKTGWRDALVETWQIRELLLVEGLLKDASYLSEEDRVRAYHEKVSTDGNLSKSRRQFFVEKKKLQKIAEENKK